MARHDQLNPLNWTICCVLCEVAPSTSNGVFCAPCRADFRESARDWAGVR